LLLFLGNTIVTFTIEINYLIFFVELRRHNRNIDKHINTT
jgi:hypothetical protein